MPYNHGVPCTKKTSLYIQLPIWAAKNLRFSLRVSVVRAYDDVVVFGLGFEFLFKSG
jgi:hypothetical protein